MFDPDEWADIFKKAGAQCKLYSVLAGCIALCKQIYQYTYIVAQFTFGFNSLLRRCSDV